MRLDGFWITPSMSFQRFYMLSAARFAQVDTRGLHAALRCGCLCLSFSDKKVSALCRSAAARLLTDTRRHGFAFRELVLSMTENGSIALGKALSGPPLFLARLGRRRRVFQSSKSIASVAGRALGQEIRVGFRGLPLDPLDQTGRLEDVGSSHICALARESGMVQRLLCPSPEDWSIPSPRGLRHLVEAVNDTIV